MRIVMGLSLEGLLLLSVLAAPAQAARLTDSTPIPVRLDGVINSETTKSGEPLDFVVITDIRVGDEVVIPKGSVAKGVVVRARPSHWGFFQRDPKLTVKFTAVMARDGHVVTLRATPTRTGTASVPIERRTHREHELLWAGSADIFQAYVDGDHDI